MDLNAKECRNFLATKHKGHREKNTNLTKVNKFPNPHIVKPLPKRLKNRTVYKPLSWQ
jgi:hypothetical protein